MTLEDAVDEGGAGFSRCVCEGEADKRLFELSVKEGLTDSCGHLREGFLARSGDWGVKRDAHGGRAP